MEIFFKIVLFIVSFLGICYLGILYLNYASDKEKKEYELEHLRQAQKQREIDQIRDEYREKEKLLREKELQLEKEKNQIEREKRFVYNLSSTPPKVYFVKDNFDDYVNNIKPPYLKSIVSITKACHKALHRVLRTTTENFSVLNVSPHFSINAASLLLRIANYISLQYNGEFQEVSNSVEKSLEKMYLLCGFHDNLDATNLNSDFSLMKDIRYFDLFYDDELTPIQNWVTGNHNTTNFNEKRIAAFCNYFFDMIFLPVFFSETECGEIYSNRENISIEDRSDAQAFFVNHCFDYIIGYCNTLVGIFEEHFSSFRLKRMEAADNDDLAWIYEYDKSDFKLFDYYYPFPQERSGS